MCDVVFQMGLEVVLIFKDLFTALTPSMASRRSAVLQERMFGCEGTLTQRALEDAVASIDDDGRGHDLDSRGLLSSTVPEWPPST
jgi:hypothetical protein